MFAARVQTSLNPRFASFAALCSLVLAALPVRAADKQACLAAHVAAQERRIAGTLVEARKALIVCSQEVCPTAVRTECINWLGEVDHALPSLVFIVNDSEKHELTAVRVLVDGVTVRENLNGLSVPVDPGEHVVRFQATGFRDQEMRVLVHEGAKSQPVNATLTPFPSTATTSPGGEVRAEAYIFGATAALGLAAFAYFGLTGQSAKRDLDACRPHCESDEVSDVRRKFLFADVGLGVGAVSLGLASYFFFTRRDPALVTGTAAVSVSPRAAEARWTTSF